MQAQEESKFVNGGIFKISYYEIYYTEKIAQVLCKIQMYFSTKEKNIYIVLKESIIIPMSIQCDKVLSRDYMRRHT